MMRAWVVLLVVARSAGLWPTLDSEVLIAVPVTSNVSQLAELVVVRQQDRLADSARAACLRIRPQQVDQCAARLRVQPLPDLREAGQPVDVANGPVPRVRHDAHDKVFGVAHVELHEDAAALVLPVVAHAAERLKRHDHLSAAGGEGSTRFVRLSSASSPALSSRAKMPRERPAWSLGKVM